MKYSTLKTGDEFNELVNRFEGLNRVAPALDAAARNFLESANIESEQDMLNLKNDVALLFELRDSFCELARENPIPNGEPKMKVSG